MLHDLAVAEDVAIDHLFFGAEKGTLDHVHDGGFVFLVEILDTLPGDMEEVIEYEGKYYVTTNRRISYMEDKIADERYFILTLFAIAKELSYREKNEGLCFYS